MEKTKTKTLLECAILIALATALSVIPLGIVMPLGGKLTLLSMLPICMISIRHGLSWGFASSFLYSLIQFALDITKAMAWGLNAGQWIGMILFDYVLAFTVLGIAGIFAKKGMPGVIGGVVLALVLRFVCHVISGVFIFDIWCPEEWSSPLLYSICYNGAFMLPELIFTCIGAAVVYKAVFKATKMKL